MMVVSSCAPSIVSAKQIFLWQFNQFALRRNSGGFFLRPVPPAARSPLFLRQPGFDFFGVALVVEGEEAVEDGAAGGANCHSISPFKVRAL